MLTSPWDGIPLFPEITGGHWIRHKVHGMYAIVMWDRVSRTWCMFADDTHYTPEFVAEHHHYIGYIPTPDASTFILAQQETVGGTKH